MQIASDIFSGLLRFALEDHGAHVHDRDCWQAYRQSMMVDDGTALILWSSSGYMKADATAPGVVAGFELARTN